MKEPEIRQWTRTELELEKLAQEREGMEAPARQEQLQSAATTEALKLGINIPGYKAALKDQVDAWRIADLLTGERHSIELHWTVYDLLQNWLRAEFPGVRFGRWPWGNWWTLRLTYFNPVKRELEKTEISMVIKST